MTCPHCQPQLLCPYCYRHNNIECYCEAGGSYGCNVCGNGFLVHSGEYYSQKPKKRLGKALYYDPYPEVDVATLATFLSAEYWKHERAYDYGTWEKVANALRQQYEVRKK